VDVNLGAVMPPPRWAIGGGMPQVPCEWIAEPDPGGLPARSPSWQVGGMERVLGIGGYFMRADHPGALSEWYRDYLGLDAVRTACGLRETG